MLRRHKLIVQGEVTALLSAMREGGSGGRWMEISKSNMEESQDPLIHNLLSLQAKLLKEQYIDMLEIVRPFCSVVTSKETTGPITGLAISALNKFLASGLLGPDHVSAAQGIREVGEAVTHARFVGTNTSNDEVVLMRILNILNTLLSVPAGQLLTNESVCEIMQSCFRICFEGRLSELLRYFAENTLTEMVRILFTNIGTLEDIPTTSEGEVESLLKTEPNQNEEEVISSYGNKQEEEEEEPKLESDSVAEGETQKDEGNVSSPSPESKSPQRNGGSSSGDGFTASTGVHFASTTGGGGEGGEPHGMPCVREVLRFLIAIINPRDKNNSERLICIGLDLVTIMLECSGSSLGNIRSLKSLVQDGLCHHLLTLLNDDSLDVFGRSLRNCYLLFDSNRQHLKLQLERFLIKLMRILQTDYSRQSPGKQELTLECLIQFCHVTNFIPELYVNYDCSTHCICVCEKLSKLLAKIAFTGSHHTVLSTNILALDTLLAVLTALGSTDTSEISPVNEPAGQVTSRPSSEGLVLSDMTGGGSNTDLLRKGDDIITMPGAPSELLKARQLKKLIMAGTDEFNQKPSRGITFLMEQGVLQTPLDPVEVATFLHSNPAISKQMLGDYLGDRRNTAVLEAFVKSFTFHNVSLVDALREFLESFRLPGEAPVISGIMEKFSAHWMSCNENGLATLFANQDSIFVLCYAILMLHTDLHNSRLKQKMSLEEFIQARRGMNNGEDFPRELLTEIYHSIRTVEIILPSEHEGMVREDYEWKVLLRRSASKDSEYFRISNSLYNQDVFILCWGSVAAALSSALNNWPAHSNLYKKIMSGYKLCAMKAAQYEQCEVFDNLIISLSKFSSLINHHDPPLSVSVTAILTNELRARLSLESMLSLAHRHGNLLREGWKNILDCLLCLFRARLLPDSMVTVCDFVSGTTSLYAEEAPIARPDSSLLSSFFSVNYWLLAGETANSNQSSLKSLSPSEVKQRNNLVKWIQDCGTELLFSESKFLNEDSLLELTKTLIFGSQGPDVHNTLGTVFDEETAIFYLELLIIVTLANRDRVAIFLEDVLNHLTTCIHLTQECRKLRERASICLIHLSIRLLHKDNIKNSILCSLQSLLLVPTSLFVSNRSLQHQIAHGLMDLIRSQGRNLNTSSEWLTIFSLLEFVATLTYNHSNSIEATLKKDAEPEDSTSSGPPSLVTGKDWVVISNLSAERPAVNRFDILIEDNLPPQDAESFFVACETLSYIVREEQYVNQENFTICLKTVRLFTEITSSFPAINYDAHVSKSKQRHAPPAEKTYVQCALKLLDLLDTLYLRTSQLFANNESKDDGVSKMWHSCWCPLLEGMARMCCDPRRSVRQAAIAYLYRGLLAHTLHHTLTAQDWEACFLEVFFPMLSRLMEEGGGSQSDLEEARIRSCNLLCKVFLQQLPLIYSLATFNDLWVGILDIMDKYMHIEGSELLPEAIPESLKNMLLVMVTQDALHIGTSPPTQEEELTNQLWVVTWKRIEQFLPKFLIDLFPESLPPPPITASTSPVMEQPRPKPASQPVTDVSPSLSPLSQSPNEENFSILIHPPLPTPPTMAANNESSNQIDTSAGSHDTTNE